MAKHTPGPWIWGDGYRGLYGAGPNNEVLNHAEYEGMWVAYGASRDANACLIASAPELLEALQEAIKEYENLPHSLGYEFTHLPMMRAAIAKATGQCLKGEE